MSKAPHPRGVREHQASDERPFFLIVIAAMIFLFAISLYSQPELRRAERLWPFGLAMGLHTLLHWLMPRIAATKQRALIYLLGQTLLAAGLIAYTGEAALLFGLPFALLGEGVGLFRTRLVVILLSLGCLVFVVSGLFFLRQGGPVPLLLLFGWVPWIFFIIIYVTLYSRQAEAREEAQRLYRDLDMAHRRLAEYAVKTEEVTLLAERERMARELHDTLAQGLSGLVLQLEAASLHLNKGDYRRVGEILDRARGKARTTLADSRKAIDDLRREQDDDLGTLLSRCAEDFSRDYAIPCLYTGFAGGEILPHNSPAAHHLLRIAQEALRNAGRHSRASEVALSCRVEEGGLLLSVEDDGIGFDPDQVSEGHYGLLGMRERSRLVGGRLRVGPGRAGGTRVEVRIPLSPAGEKGVGGHGH